MPSLKGLTYPATRTPQYKTTRPQAISGKETRIARWKSPRYQWALSWALLRQGAMEGTTFTEFAALEGFFEQLKGGFDSFLYEDPNDNSVTDQQIGVGTGSISAFPLVRTFGGVAIPILAPNLSKSVTIKVNGTPIDPSGYAITPWGTSDTNGPGVLEFGSPPAGGALISGSFSFYFPCRFDDDTMDFDLFTRQMYAVSKTTFTSIK